MEPTATDPLIIYAREHLANLKTYWPVPVEEIDTQAAIVETLELVRAITADHKIIWDLLRAVVEAERTAAHAEALVRRAEEERDATL